MKYISLLCLAFCLTFPSAAEVVFVQASKGSFNDLAFKKYKKQHNKPELFAKFSGSLTNTFEQGAKNNRLVFTAVANSSINGLLVPQAVKALQRYKIKRVIARIELPIQFCAYVRKNTLTAPKVDSVVSHPAALLQTSQWIKNNKYKTKDELAGTAQAIKNLSLGKYSKSVVAIGSCQAGSTFNNLTLFAKNIGNDKSDRTQFFLMKVEKRTEPIRFESAYTELGHLLRHLNLKKE